MIRPRKTCKFCMGTGVSGSNGEPCPRCRMKKLNAARVRKVRPTLRRGEPSNAEREAARVLCHDRAHGRCEMPFPHKCPMYVALDGSGRGQLAHLKSKRRFGWQESAETGQKHLWACPEGHRLQHAYGWTGEKPCPKKPFVPPSVAMERNLDLLDSEPF